MMGRPQGTQDTMTCLPQMGPVGVTPSLKPKGGFTTITTGVEDLHVSLRPLLASVLSCGQLSHKTTGVEGKAVRGKISQESSLELCVT